MTVKDGNCPSSAPISEPSETPREAVGCCNENNDKETQDKSQNIPDVTFNALLSTLINETNPTPKSKKKRLSMIQESEGESEESEGESESSSYYSEEDPKVKAVTMLVESHLNLTKAILLMMEKDE
jgi:hypothetical protein